MHFLNKIIPSFLKRLDRYLLLNHRLLWETKFHFVLFFGLSALLLYTAIGYLYPVSLGVALPNALTVGLIGAVPLLILFCYWAYHQALYAIESGYGRLFAGLGHWRLLIYVSSIVLFTLPALRLGVLINDRVANVVTPLELEEDILALNVGNPFFIVNDTYYEGRDYWDSESGSIFDYLECARKNTGDNERYCDDYQFEYFGKSSFDVRSFYGKSHSENLIYHLTNYFGVDSEPYKEQKLSYIKKYSEVFGKYGGQLYSNPVKAYKFFYEGEQIQQSLSYQKVFVKDQIDTISKAQTGIESFKVVTGLKASAVLILLMAFMMYSLKLIGIRDFIIGIVSLVGVGIASVVMVSVWAEFVNYSVLREEEFFVFLSAGIILFTISKVASISTAQTYSRLLSICLVAFTLVGPFLLFWSTLALDMLNGMRVLTGADTVWNIILAGFVLHIVVTLPWLRGKYLRLKSLPRA